MTRFAAIDLSQLPAPLFVETLDYEASLTDVKSRLLALMPELDATLALESEPITKLVEAIAYLTMLLRARINDAGRANLLTHATGADLDNLGALFGVSRLVVLPANPNLSPPTSAVMETDTALRGRIQMALEGFSTAGSVGAYEFHARSADARVADVSVTSPAPGNVLVTILARDNGGMPDTALMAAVNAALNADEVRPLCDSVIVAAPSFVSFTVSAQVFIASGPDSSSVLTASQAALNAYLGQTKVLGGTVARSGILAALHQPGVLRVILDQPAADLQASTTEVPNCQSTTLGAA